MAGRKWDNPTWQAAGAEMVDAIWAHDVAMVDGTPYIVGGDRNAMRDSLHAIGDLALDNIVQGHGDVLLRGEIPETIDSSLKYLDTIESHVEQQIAAGRPKSGLRGLDIECCHKSRIPLNGLAEELHQANLAYLYDLLSHQETPNVEKAV